MAGAIPLPAVCRQCRRPFPSGFAGGGDAQMFMDGCTTGPCPWCGYPTGDVPDGTYAFIDGAVKLISRLPSSRDELRMAADLMQTAIAEGNDDLAAIRALLEAQAPSTLPLLVLLRDPAIANTLALMALVVAIIFWRFPQ